MAKYGLAKQTKGGPTYPELQKHGYDPKSARNTGLEYAAKGAAAGATIGAGGGPAGIAAGAGIGAAVGFVGGFTYDMISGGDNLSGALSSYKIQQDKEKLANQVAKTERREQKRQKETVARSPDLSKSGFVAEYDPDMMAMSSNKDEFVTGFDTFNKTKGWG